MAAAALGALTFRKMYTHAFTPYYLSPPIDFAVNEAKLMLFLTHYLWFKMVPTFEL